METEKIYKYKDLKYKKKKNNNNKKINEEKLTFFFFKFLINYTGKVYESHFEKNRIYPRLPMQIQIFQSEGKWIMPETRFNKFPALSVDPKVGISMSASDTDI